MIKHRRLQRLRVVFKYLFKTLLVWVKTLIWAGLLGLNSSVFMSIYWFYEVVSVYDEWLALESFQFVLTLIFLLE